MDTALRKRFICQYVYGYTDGNIYGNIDVRVEIPYSLRKLGDYMTNQIDRINGLLGDLGVKPPVIAATTAAITLYGSQMIDGVAVIAGDRVLVKDQADATTNGIYDCRDTTWVRSLDFDGSRDVVEGTSVYVSRGAVNARTLWAVTTVDPVIGVSDITFVFGLGITDLGRITSVADYGALGDGITDDAVAIQAAVTACAGKTLYFPLGTYIINSNITKPANGISIITDAAVKFAGTGRMFSFDSNTYHDYIGTSFTKNYDGAGVAGRGYSAISSEFQATNGFLGNGCAGFFGTKTPNNAVGFYWGINPILQLNPGLTGNGVACEVDLDNFTADGKGQGVLVTGVGNYNSQVGVAVQRGDTTSDWQFGQWIKNSETGLSIDGATVGSPLFGVTILNYPNNLLKFRPTNDTNPTDAIAFLANAADSQTNWKLTKQGGMVIGNAGTEITKHLSASATLNFGSVAAQATAELTITVTGAAQGDVCYASPNLSLTAGFTWSAYCAAANTVTVRVLNGTTAALDPDGGGGSTWRADVWKH